jgi:hypothetical protein
MPVCGRGRARSRLGQFFENAICQYSQRPLQALHMLPVGTDSKHIRPVAVAISLGCKYWQIGAANAARNSNDAPDRDCPIGRYLRHHFLHDKLLKIRLATSMRYQGRLSVRKQKARCNCLQPGLGVRTLKHYIRVPPPGMGILSVLSKENPPQGFSFESAF